MSDSATRRTLWLWPVLVGGGLMLGYGLLAAGAYWFVAHHRGASTVEFLDIALPSRWPRYQVKRGNHHIEQALLLLQDGKFPQGFYLLRVGLTRAPANREGRLLLAQIFTEIKRPDLTQQTLIEGLTYHDSDRDYVSTLFRFLLGSQEDNLIVSLGNRLLKSHTDPATTAVVATSVATACFYRGNYDQAEDCLARHGLATTREGRLLNARIEWERGYHQLALVLLRDLSQSAPADEEVYVQLGNYLRQEDYYDEARRLAVLHQFAYPDRARSLIDQLYALEKTGDLPALNAVANEVFHKFGDDQVSLLSLGDFAASTGQYELAQRLLAHFQNHQLREEPAVRLMAIESLLVAQRYAEALPPIQLLLKQAQLDTHYLNVGHGLQAIAQYGLHDPTAGSISLTTLMAQPNLRVESLLAVANRLIAMGNFTPAREVLTRTVNLNPQNQPALTRLIELDLDSENIPAITSHLRQLLTMRKPSVDVLTRTQKLLRSDAQLFLPDRFALLSSIEHTLGGQKSMPSG